MGFVRGVAILAAASILASCTTATDVVSKFTGEPESGVDTDKLAAVLADERRADDVARDVYRHPGETIEFFGLKPGDTVVEAMPGGGWYSRVIMPYIYPDGSYMAMNYSVDVFVDIFGEGFDGPFRDSLETWKDTFPEEGLKNGPEGSSIDAVFTVDDEVSNEIKGTADSFLYIRTLHNVARAGRLEKSAQIAFDVLKPGGTVGIVQHRAKADAPAETSDGSKGYLKQADIIAAFEKVGFVLEATSEINANPKDTADYEGGVWTLPPSFRLGDEDKDKYQAIGESDRMTVRLRKPAK